MLSVTKAHKKMKLEFEIKILLMLFEIRPQEAPYLFADMLHAPFASHSTTFHATSIHHIRHTYSYSVSSMVADPYHATLTARREPLFHKTCRTWLQYILTNKYIKLYTDHHIYIRILLFRIRV